MAGACANIALADHGFSAPRAESLVALPGGRVPRYRLAQPTLLPWTRQALVRDEDGQPLLVDPAASATA